MNEELQGVFETGLYMEFVEYDTPDDIDHMVIQTQAHEEEQNRYRTVPFTTPERDGARNFVVPEIVPRTAPDAVPENISDTGFG